MFINKQCFLGKAADTVVQWLSWFEFTHSPKLCSLDLVILNCLLMQMIVHPYVFTLMTFPECILQKVLAVCSLYVCMSCMYVHTHRLRREDSGHSNSTKATETCSPQKCSSTCIIRREKWANTMEFTTKRKKHEKKSATVQTWNIPTTPAFPHICDSDS